MRKRVRNTDFDATSQVDGCDCSLRASIHHPSSVIRHWISISARRTGWDRKRQRRRFRRRRRSRQERSLDLFQRRRRQLRGSGMDLFHLLELRCPKLHESLTSDSAQAQDPRGPAFGCGLANANGAIGPLNSSRLHSQPLDSNRRSAHLSMERSA